MFSLRWALNGSIRPQGVRILAPMFLRGIWTSTRPMLLRGNYSMDEYSRHEFWESMHQWINTRPIFLGGYPSMDQSCPWLTGHSFMDEYLPHVLRTVFIHVRILASCFQEGIRQSLMSTRYIGWSQANTWYLEEQVLHTVRTSSVLLLYTWYWYWSNILTRWRISMFSSNRTYDIDKTYMFRYFYYQ